MSEGGFLPPVVARLTANITEFSAKMAEARGEMDETEKKGESSGKGTATKWAGALALGAAAGAAAVAGYAVKAGVSMQSADADLAAHGDLSVATATKIGNSFLNLGFSSTFSGQQMVAALAPVAGQLKSVDGGALNTADSLSVMRAASDLAEASGGKLGATTQSLVGVMQAYNIGATLSGRVTDILWNVSKSTGVGVAQLATTFEKLHSKLGENAPDIATVGGALLDLHGHGIQGRAAISGLTSGLSTLLSNSKPVSDMAKTLGINIYDSSGQFVGLRSVIAQLSPKLQGMTKEQRYAAESALIGKGNVASLSGTLLAGVGAFDAATVAANKHGAAQKAAEIQSRTFEGELKKAEAGVENLATKLGEYLIPKLITVAGFIANKVVPVIKSLWSDAAPYVARLRDFIVTVFEGDVLPALKTFATWITGTLIPGIKNIWTGAQPYIERFRAFIVPVFEDVAKKVGGALRSVAGFIEKDVIPAIGKVVQFVTAHKEILIGFAVGFAAVIVSAVVPAFASWAIGAASAAAATLAAAAPIVAIVAGIALVVAALLYAYNHWKWFHDAVQAAWKGIQAAAKAAWNDVLKPTFEAIKNWIVKDGIPDAKKLWDGIKVAFKGIETAVQGAWRDVIKPTFDFLVQAVKDIATIASWLWTNIFVPVFHGIADAVQVAWTDFIKPTWTLLTDGIKAVALVVGWLWNSVFVPAWQGISAAVGVAWTVFLQPIWNAIKTAIGLVGTVIKTLKSDWGVAWSAIQQTVSDAWNFISKIFDKIKAGVSDVTSAVSTVASWLGLGGGSKKPTPASTTTGGGGLTHKSALLPSGVLGGKSATLPAGALLGMLTKATPGGTLISGLTNPALTGSLLTDISTSAGSASVLYTMKSPIQTGSMVDWLKNPAPSGSLLANLLAHGAGGPGAPTLLSQPFGVKPTLLSQPFPHAVSPVAAPTSINWNVTLNVAGSVSTQDDLLQSMRSGLLEVGRSLPGGIFGRYAGNVGGGGSQ